MGMAPLALFSKAEGFGVSGFDDRADPRVKKMLEENSVRVEDSFDAEKLKRADEFVISSALASRIPSFNFSKTLRRGEFFARICAERKLVSVTGSHGKSSVTALLAHAVNRTHAQNCGYMVGALPAAFAPAKHCRAGDFIIAEIDESDGTIENFSPEITVALNSDLDHTDRYADPSRIEEMFARLFARTKGKVIILADDAPLMRAAASAKKDFVTVERQDEFISTNELFARAAYAEIFKRELPENIFDDFGGVVRRQEILLKTENFTAIADYAHHPSEVAAFLKWLESRHPERKIIIFQPHRYTRTKYFADDFARILEGAQNAEIFLCPVYAASEPFDENATAKEIAKRSEKISLISGDGELEKILHDARAAGGEKLCVAVVGAGDVYFKAKEFLK